MLRNIIGAAIGSKFAKNSPAVGGATGAAIATAVPFVLSRLSIPGMLALGVGGYVAKRYFDKKNTETEQETAKSAPTKKAKKSAGTGNVINPPPAGATNGSSLPSPTMQ
ncbi:MAG: hypothetical protein AAF250_08455 [Pseudomonadota bacterium]